jgi:hypothetical protein
LTRTECVATGALSLNVTSPTWQMLLRSAFAVSNLKVPPSPLKQIEGFGDIRPIAQFCERRFSASTIAAARRTIPRIGRGLNARATCLPRSDPVGSRLDQIQELQVAPRCPIEAA